MTQKEGKQRNQPMLRPYVKIWLIGNSGNFRKKSFGLAGIKDHLIALLHTNFDHTSQHLRAARVIIEQVKESDFLFQILLKIGRSPQKTTAVDKCWWKKIHV